MNIDFSTLIFSGNCTWILKESDGWLAWRLNLPQKESVDTISKTTGEKQSNVLGSYCRIRGLFKIDEGAKISAKNYYIFLDKIFYDCYKL